MGHGTTRKTKSRLVVVFFLRHDLVWHFLAHMKLHYPFRTSLSDGKCRQSNGKYFSFDKKVKISKNNFSPDRGRAKEKLYATKEEKLRNEMKCDGSCAHLDVVSKKFDSRFINSLRNLFISGRDGRIISDRCCECTRSGVTNHLPCDASRCRSARESTRIPCR